MWTLQLPLKIASDDKSKVVKHRDGWEQPYFSLNLNQYRNAQHFILNNAKINFEIAARKLIRAAGIPRLKRCSLEYVLYPGTAQLRDIANTCSIVDKFFSDALKASKIIEDDNYQILVDIRFRFGGIDRENPRVDVTIRSLDDDLPQPESGVPRMKITTKATHVVILTKEELAAAFRKYLEEHVSLTADMVVSQFNELQDGTFEVRLESGGETAGSPPTARRKYERRPKDDPKTAMQAVKANLDEKENKEPAAPSEPANEATQTEATQPSATVLSLKEKARLEAEAMERQENAETPAPEEKKDESAPSSETAEEKIDHSDKTEAERYLDTVKGTPEEASARAKVEAEQALRADPIEGMRNAKTVEELDKAFSFSNKDKSAKAIYDVCKDSLQAPAPPTPKKGNLFSGFKRPQN